jgi:hypothetical protein
MTKRTEEEIEPLFGLCGSWLSFSLSCIAGLAACFFLWMGDLSQAWPMPRGPVGSLTVKKNKEEVLPTSFFLVNKFQKCTYSDTKNITQDNTVM